jgi:hypothetical protein
VKILSSTFKGNPNSKILKKLISQKELYGVFIGSFGRRRKSAFYLMGWYQENFLTIRSDDLVGVQIKVMGMSKEYPVTITKNNVYCDDESNLPRGFVGFLKSKFSRWWICKKKTGAYGRSFIFDFWFIVCYTLYINILLWNSLDQKSKNQFSFWAPWRVFLLNL